MKYLDKFFESLPKRQAIDLTSMSDDEIHESDSKQISQTYLLAIESGYFQELLNESVSHDICISCGGNRVSNQGLCMYCSGGIDRELLKKAESVLK